MTRYPEFGVNLNLKTWSRRIGAAVILLAVLTGCSSVVTGESWANLSTDGKYVYVAYKEQIFRILPVADPKATSDTHKIEWLKKLPNNPHFFAPPAIAEDGSLYVGSYNHSFYAFKADTGNQLEGWRVPTYTDKIVGSAAIAGDMVYIGVGDKGVYGYNRKTGQEIKFTDTKYGVWAKPLVIGGTVYAASLDHFLYALDAATLAKKWAIDCNGAIADAPTYDGQGMLYVGTWNSELLAIDISGPEPKIANTFKAQNWIWSSPVLDEGTLYFGDVHGNLYALDAKTFQQKWMLPPDAEAPGGIRGRIGLAKNVSMIRSTNSGTTTETVPTLIVYGTEGKKVYAVDANGKQVWVSALTMSDKILSDILIIGNSAIFTTLSDDQLVVALNLSSGQRDWQVRLADAQQSFQPTSQP